MRGSRTVVVHNIVLPGRSNNSNNDADGDFDSNDGFASVMMVMAMTTM